MPRGAPARRRNRPASQAERERFCIADDEVLTLAGYAITIEDHYSRHNGRFTPMDIEWAKDGLDGELYIVQARPETVASQRRPRGARGLCAAGRRRGAGRRPRGRQPMRHGRGAARRERPAALAFRPGEVLVADTTTPDWEPVMKTAAAIVTNRGGRTCHAAIVARELGIPAVVGAERATGLLRAGSVVTVSCAEGDVGKVYAGKVPFEVQTTDLAAIEKPATHIMVNLGNPDLAFKTSFAAERRRRPRPHRVHHQRAHQGASDGAARSGPGRGRGRARAHPAR